MDLNFNWTILGKQGWRFLTKPNNLVNLLYKTRYFPNTRFLDSSLGNNPSFIWRSVWEAKAVVKEGARWMVGSGNKINIIGQPWLTDAHNPYIISDVKAIRQNIIASIMCMDRGE